MDKLVNEPDNEPLHTAHHTAEVPASAIRDPITKRLRWQCRRGMKELDVLLLYYLEKLYPTAPTQEQLCFAHLLNLSDDQLYDYLVGRMTHPDPLSALLIEKLCSCSSFRC